MNIERLEAVKREIQRRSSEETDLECYHRRIGPFRSAHCIAGRAEVMFSPRLLDRILGGRFCSGGLPIGEVCALLGMEYWEANRLFNYHFWPGDLMMAYIFSTPEQRKGVVIRAIDRFISGNGSWGGEVREREVAGV